MELSRIDGVSGDQGVASVGGEIVMISAVLNLVGIGGDANNTNTSGLICMGISSSRVGHRYWDNSRIIVVVVIFIHVAARRSRPPGRTGDHAKT